MKLKSNVFVLFLVICSLMATRSLAQTFSLQPITELQASQEAHQLGEEIQRTQPQLSEAQKNEKRSADAMKWKPVFVSQESQPMLNVNRQPININKTAASRIGGHKQVNRSVKISEKPIFN